MSELVPMCFETEFKARVPDSKQTWAERAPIGLSKLEGLAWLWEISAQNWPKDLARVWLLIKVVFWGL